MEGKKEVCPIEMRMTVDRAVEAIGEFATLYTAASLEGADVRTIGREALHAISDAHDHARNTIFATEAEKRHRSRTHQPTLF